MKKIEARKHKLQVEQIKKMVTK